MSLMPSVSSTFMSSICCVCVRLPCLSMCESRGPGTTGVPATETPTTRVDGADSAGRWIPAPGTAWQWQLSGPLDLSVDVPVFDVDGFDTSAEVVAELHRRGRRVICYVNVGAWEAL